MYDATLPSQGVISFFAFEAQLRFSFDDSEIDRVCEFLIFYSTLVADSLALQLVFRISYGGLKRDN